MDEVHKEILMISVLCDTFDDVQNIFHQCTLIRDDSYFDYDLLKAALEREDLSIANFLLELGCRARNPNKINNEEPPVHLAMKLDNFKILNNVILRGASINDKNRKGDTVLYAAFKEKRYYFVDRLLNYYGTSNSQSFNPVDKDDILHFHIACIRNNLAVVKVYLKCGFDVNSPFSLDSEELSGLNAVHYANDNKYSSLFECLVQHGADFSIKNSDGLTVLHIAYYKGDASMIQNIFDHGNDTKFINSVDDNGVSHFHLCCITNNPKNAQVFIDKGADVNSSISLSCANFPGFTPLHFAVLHGYQEVVQLLLKNGADCNKEDKEGTTPLHLACMRPVFVNRQIIQMLLDYKACPDAVNKNGLTSVHMAFYNADVDYDIIVMLASKIPGAVNVTDDEGLSLFHILCTTNNASQVNDFLKSGVEIDNGVVSGKYSDYTALHFAVLYNQTAIVEMLLKKNAQANNKTSPLQFTPLHLACRNMNLKVRSDGKIDNLDYSLKCKRQLDIINLLLLHGADTDLRDSFGRTALLYACSIDRSLWSCYNGNAIKEIIEILLSNNANINACTNKKESILHIICKNDHLDNSEELVEFLLSKGADLNAADDAGLTPLHVTVALKRKKLTQIFLKYNANVNAVSKENKIPLQLLLEDDFLEYSSIDKAIFLLLLENGSDVNVQHYNNRPLWLDAIEQHQIFILEKLLNYGADINMEDSFGQPLIVPILTMWQFQSNNRANEANVKVFHFIFIHIQRLIVADFYVNDEIKICCFKLHQYYKALFLKSDENVHLDNILDYCIEELDKMRLIKINCHTTLYNVLQEDAHELSKHVRNSKLIQILDDQNFYDTFPLYSYLLKVLFKKGLIRNNLLESAKLPFSCAVGLNVPDLCYDLIVKYLNNIDIVNLKAAVMNGFKRKININSKVNSLAKLKKKSKINEIR